MGRAQAGGHRAAVAAGEGRLGPRRAGSARGIRARRHHRRVDRRTRTAVPARSGVPRGAAGRLPQVAGRGARRARLPRLARAVPAAAAPRRRHPPPGRVPHVHAERLDRPARRGARRRDDLARVHLGARGGRLQQQALREPAPGRLHARVRHQLGGAVPRDGRHARDPDVHVGRDLPGSRGGALPPGRACGIRDHEARTPRRRGVAARRSRARRAHVRDVGHHPRPHAHARRPAVRSVHDQAAHAVLPVLARRTAVRPDRIPRVGEDRARAAGEVDDGAHRAARRRHSRRSSSSCSSTRSSCSMR